MKPTILRWLPWALVAAALTLFLVIPGVNGPVLLLAWGGIMGLYRYGVAVLPDRRSRLVVDGFCAFACLLAAFEGGWYLLPAVLAFSIEDLVAEGTFDTDTTAGAGAPPTGA